MLIKKLFSFSIGNILSLIIGLISVPIITRLISPEEYGIVTLFLTVMNIITVIVLAGLDQAIVRLYYEVNRKNLLKKSLIISVLISLLMSCVFLIFIDEIVKYFSYQYIYIILMIVYMFAIIVFKYSTIILRMMQKGFSYSLIQVLQKILELVFVVSISVLYFSNNLTVILASIITLIILNVITQFFIISFWKEQTKEQTYEIKYNSLLKYSFPLLIASFLAILLQSLDKVFLMHFSDSYELGIYSAAFKIIVILNVIQTSFALFWAPVCNERYKNSPEDKEFFSNISAVVSLVMLSVGILVVLFKDIVVFILGTEYREASAILGALVLMPILYTMSETTVVGINFKMKPKIHVFISLITVFVNIILCLVLVPNFGGVGASFAVGLSYVVFYLLRTYFGLKNFYFDAKVKSSLISIVLLLLWIVLDIVMDGYVILLIGAFLNFIVLFILFRKEISFIQQRLSIMKNNL